MSDKQNKFQPSIGWIVTVNHQQVSILRLAETLKLDNVTLSKALDEAGYILTPDTFNIANDCAKLFEVEARTPSKRTDLKVAPEFSMADIAESVTELDEEEAEKE